MISFEDELAVSVENIEFSLTFADSIAWSNFLLNPRRLRGSDFLMRWSQGQWSESRLVHAVGETNQFFAIPYGPSGTAPNNDVREFELYFERLEAAGLGNLKRPDLLVFSTKVADRVERILHALGGTPELPFISEDDQRMVDLIAQACVSIECENSLWVAAKMPDFGRELDLKRLAKGNPGLPKSVVLPTIIIKEEDIGRLLDWQAKNSKPIHVWHTFYDRSYGISLEYANELISTGAIVGTRQTFQAPGGATSHKTIYKVYYHYGYSLAVSNEEPQLEAAHIIDKNGHILPYVKFVGGQVTLQPGAITQLNELETARRQE